jgi:hypothetical protein
MAGTSTVVVSQFSAEPINIAFLYLHRCGIILPPSAPLSCSFTAIVLIIVSDVAFFKTLKKNVDFKAFHFKINISIIYIS